MTTTVGKKASYVVRPRPAHEHELVPPPRSPQELQMAARLAQTPREQAQ